MSFILYWQRPAKADFFYQNQTTETSDTNLHNTSETDQFAYSLEPIEMLIIEQMKWNLSDPRCHISTLDKRNCRPNDLWALD